MVLLRRDRSITKVSRSDHQGRFAIRGVAPGPVWLRAVGVDEPPAFDSSPVDEQELTIEPDGRINGVKLLLGTGAATAPRQRPP
jgi:hypothetical protein